MAYYSGFQTNFVQRNAFQIKGGDNPPVSGGSAPILGHAIKPLWTQTIIKPEIKAISIEPRAKVSERKEDIVLTSLSELGEVFKITETEQKVITAADALEREITKQELITKQRLAQQMLDDDAIVMMLLLN